MMLFVACCLWFVACCVIPVVCVFAFCSYPPSHSINRECNLWFPSLVLTHMHSLSFDRVFLSFPLMICVSAMPPTKLPTIFPLESLESPPTNRPTKPNKPINQTKPKIRSGSVAFIHAQVGLGVFVARAGSNRLALHLGANDGFRSVRLVC